MWKNDGFEIKFSIDVSLKIFGRIQYHQYGNVKHCSSPGLYARQKKITNWTLQSEDIDENVDTFKKTVHADFPLDHCDEVVSTLKRFGNPLQAG